MERDREGTREFSPVSAQTSVQSRCVDQRVSDDTWARTLLPPPFLSVAAQPSLTPDLTSHNWKGLVSWEGGEI